MTATPDAPNTPSEASDAVERPPWTAVLCHRLGSLSPWPALLGIIGVQLGLLRPLHGFGGLFLTLCFAAVALLSGGTALLLTRRSRSELTRAKLRTGLGVAIVVLVLPLIAVLRSGGAPPINDITTDLDHPPDFRITQRTEALRGKDLVYPEEFKPIVRDAYPDLKPIELQMPSYMAYTAARSAADELGWEVVAENAEQGRYEARDTSLVYRFVDDVVVRVREGSSPSRSIVDIRSRSRDGRGDLGVNAARIRRFRDLLQ